MLCTWQMSMHRGAAAGFPRHDWWTWFPSILISSEQDRSNYWMCHVIHWQCLSRPGLLWSSSLITCMLFIDRVDKKTFVNVIGAQFLGPAVSPGSIYVASVLDSSTDILCIRGNAWPSRCSTIIVIVKYNVASLLFAFLSQWYHKESLLYDHVKNIRENYMDLVVRRC